MAADPVNYDAITRKFDSSAYELLEKIGEGGFGSVYRAKQVNTDQIVAIKFLVISPEFDETKKQRYIERFEREALLCSKLEHPNIVRLLDKGRCKDDLLYAVFEYVDGKNLKEVLIDSGTLPAVETAEIMGQVLEALVHAHEQGVIHRDIKPANIMLQRTGVRTYAKVLDFGIGTLVSEARQKDYKTLTLTQEALGTPSYSAPEQLRGEAPTVRTDIYVWALVFLECLTGEPAVTGPNLASVFHKQLSQTNVPLPAALVGHPIAALLRRALQKKAHERTITSSELFVELKQLNFSNLVGNLSGQNTIASADTTACVSVSEQLTMANDNVHAFTRLTERKQITVLAVCVKARKASDDIVDAEIVEALHHDQKNQCVDIAVRYNGTHVGTLGDTMLFYFGYPAVSDNDARFCARTALDIISSLGKRNTQLSHEHGIVMQARLGMHTGLVTTYVDSTPEGDTPNTALELARLAGNDQILCSDITRKLLEAYIQFDPASVIEAGVNAEQIPTFKLTGERLVEAFGFLRGTQRNECFIGREQELETLNRILEHQNRSEKLPRLAHVFGEAGIGKSRLVFELRNKAKGCYHYVAQCLPEHQNNALYPILNLLKFKYSLDALDSDQTASLLMELAQKLDNDSSSVVIPALPILFAWLNIPLSEGMEPSAFAPDVQKQYLFNALSALFMHNEGHDAKKLYIFEDMHWADPTSIEFIAQFSAIVQASGDVFISTSRQPLPEPLADKGFEPVEVKRLGSESTKDFISALFDKEAIGKDVLQLLIDRTDGIPLFIEELVNMLRQKELVHKLNGMIVFVSPDKLDEVPVSLRDSLQQKLDSLVYAKETAQLAATIGREFDYDLLIAASNHTESQVQNDLNELISSGLVYLQRKVSGDSYIFKHALVRDSVYDSIVGADKQSNNKQIALAYERDFIEKAHEQPWLVANHFAEAGNIIKASEWGLNYLNNLLHLSLNMEAVNVFEIIKGWLKEIDDTVVESYLYTILINDAVFTAYTKRFGWGYEALEELAEENLRLVKLVQGLELPFPVNIADVKYKAEWVLFAFNHYQGNRREARKRGEELYRNSLGGNRKNRVMLGTMLGQAYFFDGDFEKASLLFNDVMNSYDVNKDINLNVEFGFDPYLMAAGNMMSIEVMSGRISKGTEFRDLCLEYAINTGNKAAIITGYTWGTCYYFLLNDKDGMFEWCKLARKNNPEVFEGEWIQRYFNSNEDWYYSKVENGLKVISEDIESGQTGILSWYEPPVAISLISLGRHEEAKEVMYNSYNRSFESGDICVIAITLRELARAEWRCSRNIDKAMEFYNLSLDFAEKTGSKYLELVTACNILKDITSLESDVKRSLKDRLSSLLEEVDSSESNIWLEISKNILETSDGSK